MKPFELVYVVEDDRITSRLTELHLHRHGAFGRVQTYANGQPAFDALLRAAEHPTRLPDLILLDLNMPVMDGWEFLDAVAAQHFQKPVRVCVLTSSIQPDDVTKASAYEDVKGYFSKPVGTEVLNRVVELLG